MLELVGTESYTSQLVRSFMAGIVAEKLTTKGFTKRKDGLLEDCVGAVYTLDLKVTSEEVKVVFKQVPVVQF